MGRILQTDVQEKPCKKRQIDPELLQKYKGQEERLLSEWVKVWYERYINWDYQVGEYLDHINAYVLKLSIRLGPMEILGGEKVPTLWGGINFIFEIFKYNAEWEESSFY